jgi:hypothetical protein
MAMVEIRVIEHEVSLPFKIFRCTVGLIMSPPAGLLVFSWETKTDLQHSLL